MVYVEKAISPITVCSQNVPFVNLNQIKMTKLKTVLVLNIEMENHIVKDVKMDLEETKLTINVPKSIDLND